ncbi:unnamed protein product, partial [Oppiella nova]
MSASNETSNLCQKFRKSLSITNSLSKYLWKPNYNDYTEEISETRTNWKSEASKAHFISGVLLGNGALNLVFSHLPKRVLKLLEMIGFSGDRS